MLYVPEGFVVICIIFFLPIPKSVGHLCLLCLFYGTSKNNSGPNDHALYVGTCLSIVVPQACFCLPFHPIPPSQTIKAFSRSTHLSHLPSVQPEGIKCALLKVLSEQLRLFALKTNIEDR